MRVEAEAPGDGVIVEIVEVETDADGSERLGDALGFEPAGRVVGRARSGCSPSPAPTSSPCESPRRSTGDPSDLHARVPNIARARVTVTA